MTIETNAWINPRNGEVRYYINGFWYDMLGLELQRYKTGNISYASIDGEKIANGRAGRLSGKLWADAEGNLHLDYFNGDIFYTAEEALERIAKYIADNGGLDFLKEEDAEDEEQQVEDAPIAEAQAHEAPVELTEEEIQAITTAGPGGTAHHEIMYGIALRRQVPAPRISEAYMRLAKEKAKAAGAGKASRMARAAFRWAQEIMAQ